MFIKKPKKPNTHVSRYLPNPFATDSMWRKVNFEVEYS